MIPRARRTAARSDRLLVSGRERWRARRAGRGYRRGRLDPGWRASARGASAAGGSIPRAGRGFAA